MTIASGRKSWIWIWHRGGVGENWTLVHAREDTICLLDVYAVGTAQVQVSKPRTPCHKQAKRVGRPDWVRLVLQELRTGFYLQVLRPGTVRAGDVWHLQERPYPDISLRALNRCVHQQFDPELAARANAIPVLDPFWRKQLTKAAVTANAAHA